MTRLYIYVEGQTEQQYAETVLRDHLSRFGVFVAGAILAATRRRHGIVRRGGGRHFLPARNDLARLFRQHRGSEVRFTTMFDFYSLYSDFPGTEEANKQEHIPHERVKTLEQAFAQEMQDHRLIPHIQLHEFETMLYCQLDAFEIHYADCRRQIDALAQDAGKLLATPELIDDGQHTAPSKRIEKQFSDYPHAKPEAPVAIATVIDLSLIRSKCPHFNEWLTRLEQLNSVRAS
jgi:hypothetical protein